ncbi:MAG: hypothetical protein MJZ37_08275 [Bacilli bacterium]|nr:hypothetical protein [Bacilli bacterium]
MTKRKIKKLSKSSITIYRNKPRFNEAIRNRIKLKLIKMVLDLAQDLYKTDKEIIDTIIEIVYDKKV